jgi:DNA-directed RNA polymerase subunit alpha
VALGPRRDSRKARDLTIHKNWQELIKPNKLEVKPGHDARLLGDRGRRAAGARFRSDAGQRPAPGSAVVAPGCGRHRVQIDGVLHEFSSIPGVREDVTDIVLNIKEIAIRMQGEGPKRMVVRKQGPGVVTAGDIQTVGDIEVLNPDLRSAPSTRALKSAWSSPSTPARAMSRPTATVPEDAPIGLIPVDSLYSPVKKVSYKVENTREGQVLDYDKLTLTSRPTARSPRRMPWPSPRASCRTSFRSSSTSKSRSRK